jgi:micrococcal nuclease
MLVTGRTITLTYDEECQDRYGRLLAYVSVGDVEVNRTLLEDGYACILHISPNGDDRVAEYQALETMAKNEGIGMWSACGTVACD